MDAAALSRLEAIVQSAIASSNPAPQQGRRVTFGSGELAAPARTAAATAAASVSTTAAGGGSHAAGNGHPQSRDGHAVSPAQPRRQGPGWSPFAKAAALLFEPDVAPAAANRTDDSMMRHSESADTRAAVDGLRKRAAGITAALVQSESVGGAGHAVDEEAARELAEHVTAFKRELVALKAALGRALNKPPDGEHRVSESPVATATSPPPPVAAASARAQRPRVLFSSDVNSVAAPSSRVQGVGRDAASGITRGVTAPPAVAASAHTLADDTSAEGHQRLPGVGAVASSPSLPPGGEAFNAASPPQDRPATGVAPNSGEVAAALGAHAYPAPFEQPQAAAERATASSGAVEYVLSTGGSPGERTHRPKKQKRKGRKAVSRERRARRASLLSPTAASAARARSRDSPNGTKRDPDTPTSPQLGWNSSTGRGTVAKSHATSPTARPASPSRAARANRLPVVVARPIDETDAAGLSSLIGERVEAYRALPTLGEALSKSAAAAASKRQPERREGVESPPEGVDARDGGVTRGSGTVDGSPSRGQTSPRSPTTSRPRPRDSRALWEGVWETGDQRSRDSMSPGSGVSPYDDFKAPDASPPPTVHALRAGEDVTTRRAASSPEREGDSAPPSPTLSGRGEVTGGLAAGQSDGLSPAASSSNGIIEGHSEQNGAAGVRSIVPDAGVGADHDAQSPPVRQVRLSPTVAPGAALRRSAPPHARAAAGRAATGGAAQYAASSKRSAMLSSSEPTPPPRIPCHTSMGLLFQKGAGTGYLLAQFGADDAELFSAASPVAPDTPERQATPPPPPPPPRQSASAMREPTVVSSAATSPDIGGAPTLPPPPAVNWPPFVLSQAPAARQKPATPPATTVDEWPYDDPTAAPFGNDSATAGLGAWETSSAAAHPSPPDAAGIAEVAVRERDGSPVDTPSRPASAVADGSGEAAAAPRGAVRGARRTARITRPSARSLMRAGKKKHHSGAHAYLRGKRP